MCCWEMDVVDEEMIMWFCYVFEFDKFYILFDLGLSVEIVDRMWMKRLFLVGILLYNG